MKALVRLGLFAVYCVVVVELLLQVAVRLDPGIDRRLSGNSGEPALIQDPDLGVVGNPDYPYNDRRGFRNPVALDRAEIVTLGDSQTLGANAGLGESWPLQLGGLLSTTVYDFGLTATGPVYYRYLLPRALRLRPKWVLTGFYSGNDLWDTMVEYYSYHFPGVNPAPRDSGKVRLVRDQARRLEQERVEAARFLVYQPPARAEKRGSRSTPAPKTNPVDFLREHSKLWGAVRSIKAGMSARFGSPRQPRHKDRFNRRHWDQLVRAAQHDPDLLVYQRDSTRTVLNMGHRSLGVDLQEDPLLREGLSLSLRELLSIDRGVKGKGGKHLVVLIPSKEYVFAPLLTPEQMRNSLAEKVVRGETEIWSRTREFLDRNDVDYVDVAPALREAVREGRQVYSYSTEGHPNAEGYEVIAGAVATALRERGFGRR